MMVNYFNFPCAFICFVLVTLVVDNIQSFPASASEPISLSAPVGKITTCYTVAKTAVLSAPINLRPTFDDSFEQLPSKSGRWVTHFQDSDKFPEIAYIRGPGSDIKRTLKGDGEEQIYVDPGYWGLGIQPIGLDPFVIGADGLTILAEPTPENLKYALFGAAYTSGMLSSRDYFLQKYGYFEIEARIPFGHAVWPAFWLLREDGVWPPEIDIFEGRGSRHGVLALTAHWADLANTHKSCSIDMFIADADKNFHTYGLLWEPTRLTWFVDRNAVFVAPAPAGLDRPMYMLVNLAIGSKNMTGVGLIDSETPNPKNSLRLADVA